MKIALITTVYNEEKTILSLLESISIQTKKPDKIVIVDAKSTDKTLDIINSFKAKYPKLNIKVIIKKGNRSVGRNYGIKMSDADTIVATDAGCILKKDWFEKITQPFTNRNIDVVAGFYKPITNSVFEKCLSTYTCTMSDQVTADFLPSSRSIAFRIKAWEIVGGYPEHLETCEDLVFARRLKKAKFNFIVEKKAIVYWPQRRNIIEAFAQFYSYAMGDGEAKYFRSQTPLLFVRYLIGLIIFIYFLISANIEILILLIVMFVSYLLWAIFKNLKYVKKVSAFLFLPLLQFTSDIAVIGGMTVGFFKK